MNILSFISLLIVLQGVPEDKNAERYIEEGIALEQQDKPEEALRLWEQAVGKLAVPSVAIATEYLRLSTEHELHDSYHAASFNYLWGMSGTGEKTVKDNKPALEEELGRLEQLLDRNMFNNWQALLKENDPALFEEIVRFWERIDPTPATKYNERLIEHWQRIAYARKHFTRKNDPPYGTDDRGLYYVKYGEADRVDSGRIHITNGKIRSVITKLIPNMPPDDKRTDYVMIMSNRINNLFLDPEYELWIYGTPDNMSENLILLFGSKSGSFGRVQALEDFIPNTAFGLSVYKESDTGAPIVPPGMVLQYIYYEHFATKDPYFAQQFLNFLSSVGGGKGDRTPEAYLAWQHKQKHTLDTRQILNTAPDEFSTEKKKLPEIPLDVYQYRLLDKNDKPVFVTFLESRPLQAFLGDFAANQDAMLTTTGDTGHVPAEELRASYKLTHGLQLHNEQWELIGRNRQPAPLVFNPNQNHPSSSVFVVPYVAGNITQVFYAGMKNLHPHSKPQVESLFPDSLRGLGKLQIAQPEPLSVSPGEMTVGDLIIGYQRKEQPKGNSLFDFVAANDRRIPEGENLVVHFEVYHLQTGPGGLSRFELNYEIRPTGGLFGWTRKKRDEFSITLNFEQPGDRFAESLEIEATGLEAGNYELTWTIRDLQTGQTHEQQVPFEVVEETVSS